MIVSGLLVGMIFGALVQWGQFCFVSGFRDAVWKRNPSFLFALFLAITIQSLGIFTLQSLEILKIPSTPLPLLATLLGGLVFGVGMGVAGLCVNGGWFRFGEGAIAGLVMLFAFVVTLSCAQSGLLKPYLSSLLEDPLPVDNLYLTLHLSPWWFVGGMVCLSFVLFLVSWKYKASDQRLWISAFFLGILGIVAWVLSSASGRDYGFGVSVPSAHAFLYLLTGQQRYVNWGSCFVVGIVIGAFCMAKFRGEFRWKVLDGRALLRALGGGVLMGVGAYWAGGCTVTNALVATAYFSSQGWIAMFAMIVGCALASRFFKNQTCELR